jgi:hypothetical protein
LAPVLLGAIWLAAVSVFAGHFQTFVAGFLSRHFYPLL